ncbi:MAG: amidohydrolase family protein [Devosia sp.]
MAERLIRAIDCLIEEAGQWHLRPHDLAIASGRITALAAPGAIATTNHDNVIDGHGLIAVPGLVNAHFHSPDTLIRSSAPLLPLELWSLHSAAGRERRSPREAYVSAMLGAIEMLASGTTTVLDHIRVSPDIDGAVLDAPASAYRDIGMRVVMAPILADMPVAETLPLTTADIGDDDISGWGRRRPLPAGEQMAIAEAFIERWQGKSDRIHCALGPSAPQRCTDGLLDAIATLARHRKLPVHMHLLETETQRAIGDRHPGGTLARLGELGLMGPRTSFAHAIWLNDADLDRVADAGAGVVHNPVSNARLGSGFCPLHGMLSRGIRVGLGTDSCCCNDSANMLETAKWAALLGNLVTAEHARWTGPARALKLATAGSADVIRLKSVTGRIAPGLAADLTLIRHDSPALVPLLDPARQIVLSGASVVIDRVLVAGETVMQQGRATRIDQAAIWAEARELAAARLSDTEADYSMAARMAGPISRMRQRLARERAA